jgi:hypothetical protein
VAQRSLAIASLLKKQTKVVVRVDHRWVKRQRRPVSVFRTLKLSHLFQNNRVVEKRSRALLVPPATA